ncbi:MAG: hypothetical protein R3C17_14805 [Planctomycetaceae bacterium]
MRSSRNPNQKFLKRKQGGVVAPEVCHGKIPPEITTVSQQAAPTVESLDDVDVTRIPRESGAGVSGDGLEVRLIADDRSNWLLHQFCERRKIWQMSNAIQALCVSALAAIADGNVPF